MYGQCRNLVLILRVMGTWNKLDDDDNDHDILE